MKPFVNHETAKGNAPKTVNLVSGAVSAVPNRAARVWRDENRNPWLRQAPPKLTRLPLAGKQAKPYPLMGQTGPVVPDFAGPFGGSGVVCRPYRLPGTGGAPSALGLGSEDLGNGPFSLYPAGSGDKDKNGMGDYAEFSGKPRGCFATSDEVRPHPPDSWSLQPSRLRSLRHNWMETVFGNAGSAKGLAFEVDRLEAVGNGQVPAVPALAWTRLKESMIHP